MGKSIQSLLQSNGQITLVTIWRSQIPGWMRKCLTYLHLQRRGLIVDSDWLWFSRSCFSLQSGRFRRILEEKSTIRCNTTLPWADPSYYQCAKLHISKIDRLTNGFWGSGFNMSSECKQKNLPNLKQCKGEGHSLMQNYFNHDQLSVLIKKPDSKYRIGSK